MRVNGLRLSVALVAVVIAVVVSLLCSGASGMDRALAAARPDPSAFGPTPPARLGKPLGRLTRAALRRIPDSQLEEALFDRLLAKIGTDYDQEYGCVKRLSKGCRMLFATLGAEGEVDNGGFNQYFWNSTGRYAEEARGGYKLIGATRMAALMQAAISIHRREQGNQAKFRNQGTLDAFSESYKHTSLNKLDQQFYALEKAEKLHERRIRYIRAHPEQFEDR